MKNKQQLIDEITNLPGCLKWHKKRVLECLQTEPINMRGLQFFFSLEYMNMRNTNRALDSLGNLRHALPENIKKRTLC